MTSVAQRALLSLGIHLAEPLPLFILAGLATDRRMLLVGLPGQAKTALVRAIGERLAPGSTRVLNAALTSFDDVRGFVRPASLDAGKVEVVSGPWSPYEDTLLFVDELSRAPASQQNRWLQLIHERRIDGLPTRLRWVIAAMNPPSVEGTFPLGWATVDRFHAVLELSDFGDLEPAVRLAIAAGLVAPSGSPPDLGAHLDAIAARHARIANDPTRRVMLARVTVAALDAFVLAGAPVRPQGRRAALMTELLASLFAALEVEHGEHAARALGDHLDAWITASLTALGRASDLDEAALQRAHDAAWSAATRAWEQAFEGLGSRGDDVSVAEPAAVRRAEGGGRRDGLMGIVRAALERPGLDVGAFTRSAIALWQAQAPEGLAGAPSAIQYLREGAVEVGGVEIPLSSKLVRVGDRLVHLTLDGDIDPDPGGAVVTRFAAIAPARCKPEHWAWPVPFGPIAVVVRGQERGDPAVADAAERLLRPAYCVPSVRAVFPYRALEGVPVIASTAVFEALGSRTRGGIFHPERSPRPGWGSRSPLVVFGTPHRVWRDLEALVRRHP